MEASLFLANSLCFAKVALRPVANPAPASSEPNLLQQPSHALESAITQVFDSLFWFALCLIRSVEDLGDIAGQRCNKCWEGEGTWHLPVKLIMLRYVSAGTQISLLRACWKWPYYISTHTACLCWSPSHHELVLHPGQKTCHMKQDWAVPYWQQPAFSPPESSAGAAENRSHTSKSWTNIPVMRDYLPSHQEVTKTESLLASAHSSAWTKS